MATAELIKNTHQRTELFGNHETIGAGIGLAAIAIAAYVAEHLHVTTEFFQPDRAIAESGAHPILGFVAGALVYAVTKNKTPIITKLKVGIGLSLASAIDLGVEAGQDVIVQPEQSFYSPKHQLESVKDFGFAMLGYGIFAYLNHKNHKKGITN